MRADVDRDKLKDRHNRPDAVAKGLELNDASRVQRRGKMMLPAPQVSEQELQQIAKGGGDVDMDPDLAEGGTDATRRLLGDYQTPQRWDFALCMALQYGLTDLSSAQLTCWTGLCCSFMPHFASSATWPTSQRQQQLLRSSRRCFCKQSMCCH